MIDFTAIADAAVAEIGSADPAQFQAAFDALSAQTETIAKQANWETELAVLSRLGLTTGITILETVKAAAAQILGVSTLTRIIEGERGVNLADPETVAFIGGLVAGGALTQEQADALLASNSEIQPVWPGLKPGHVQNALQMRAGGEI